MGMTLLALWEHLNENANHGRDALAHLGMNSNHGRDARAPFGGANSRVDS